MIRDDLNPPKILRDLPGWLLWRYEHKAGEAKPRKVPYYVDGRHRQGVQGSDPDRRGLTTFDAALARAIEDGSYSGLGLAMLPDWGLVGLDFDDCFDLATDELLDEVAELVSGTYAEVSPSGGGIRAFMLGELGDKKHVMKNGRDYGFETFHSKGFLTFTGNRLPTAVDEIAPLSDAVLALFDRTFKKDDEKAPSNATPGSVDLAIVRSALMAIPNPGLSAARGASYEFWLARVHEVNHAANGGAEGLEIIREWSAQYDRHNDSFLEAEYNRCDPHREGGRTYRSLLHEAREHGWTEPHDVLIEDFETLPAIVNEAGEERAEAPAIPRNAKDGSIKTTATNLKLALQVDWFCDLRIAYDTFCDEIMVAPPGSDAWQPIRDSDNFRVRIALEKQGFINPGKDLVRDAIGFVAEKKMFDSAQMWLRTRPAWDGVPRVAGFHHRYLGTENTDYATAVSEYLWSALAGRVLEPGVKADGVPIWEGAQGLGKSRAVAALVPSMNLQCNISFHEKADDLARKLRGVLVAEIGELSGLHTKELQAIKDFITLTHEQWIPKFREYKTVYPRRIVFIGTTNKDDILVDPSGNRRWFPIKVRAVDVEAIERDRDQLWAEAIVLFENRGVIYGPAIDKAEQAHEDYRMADPWEEPIENWLQQRDDFDDLESGNRSTSKGGFRWETPFQTSDVTTGALKLNAKDCNYFTNSRVRAVLERFGMVYKTVKIYGRAKKAWVAAENCIFKEDLA